MNKRIEELIKQSYFYDVPNDSTIFDREKFASLIVLECSGFVYNYPERYLTRNQSREICNAMEDYFGVTKDD
jgi:hypothetical protein